MNLPKPEIDREAAMELWISEHSEYAKEQVILNNKGLIGIVLKSLNLDLLDDDLFAIGVVGIIKAINKFDKDMGFTFSAYATQVVRNEILEDFRKKRITPVFSLDEPYDLENGEQFSYVDMIADETNFEEEVIAYMQFTEIMKNLSEREKKIIYLRMNGKKQQEIADIFGLSQERVSRIIKKACEKYKKKFN